MSTKAKHIGICPECGAEIKFKRAPFLGQIVTCHHCEIDLEVVNRFPLELDWVDNDLIEDEDDSEEFLEDSEDMSFDEDSDYYFSSKQYRETWDD